MIKMVDNVCMFVVCEDINVWDKMLILVQGGQFKVVVDSVFCEMNRFFDDLIGLIVEILWQQVQVYCLVNVVFQG